MVARRRLGVGQDGFRGPVQRTFSARGDGPRGARLGPPRRVVPGPRSHGRPDPPRATLTVPRRTRAWSLPVAPAPPVPHLGGSTPPPRSRRSSDRRLLRPPPGQDIASAARLDALP